ncbi:TlpA family protein disulfide reductase [Puteibacter caeruleilacunae]|nr:TlpA family protein disulfide reductase [Puteibacter caeruleilacunae]
MQSKLLFILFAFLSIAAQGQKVINNPKYRGSTAPFVKVTKVELTDTATILSFHVDLPKGTSIGLPDGSAICEAKIDAEKFFVKSVEGAPFNKQFPIPNKGGIDYKLFFQKLPAHISAIDFGEFNEGGSWFIYDIQLTDEAQKSMLPKKLLGSWFNEKDGSLYCSFFDDKAIFDKQMWEYEAYNETKNLDEVVLKNESGQITLYVEYDTNDNPAIGHERFDKKSIPVTTNPLVFKVGKYFYSLNPCTRNQEAAAKVQNNDKPFELPIFKVDSASYSGYIIGYTPRMGKTTGTLHFNNVLTGNQENYVVKIREDGYFNIKLQMYNPEEIYARMPFFNENIFLEPGKDLFHVIVIGDKRASLFMGESAQINTDLKKLDRLTNKDYKLFNKNILDRDVEGFKHFCLDMMNKELSKIEAYAQDHAICQKALQVQKYSTTLRYLMAAMEYDWTYENAYREKHNIPRNQRQLNIEYEKPDAAYYDFLTPEIVNDKLAAVSASLYFFFNRVKYLDILRDGQRSFKTSDIYSQLSKRGIQFTEDEHRLIAQLQEITKIQESPEHKAFDEKYGNKRTAFYRKHMKDIREFQKKDEDFDINKLRSFLVDKGITLSQDENEFIDAQIEFSEWDSSKKISAFYEEQKDGLNKLNKKYQEEINQYHKTQRIVARNEQLKSVLGIDEGFGTDVMTCEDFSRGIVEELSPVDPETLAFMKEQFSTPFVAEYLEMSNNKTIAKIEANKLNGGYHVNEVPKTEGGKLFKAIMDKYKGKVVLVDFWATWCGPCRSAIKRIAPLKEELKDKDVVFVYITNDSSPKGTWDNMIPNIKGEHYRVTRDEWNYFKEEFQISGIPHYTLVGQDGAIINPHLSHGMPNDALKSLFLKHIH